ncbi:MAG: glycosyltransferase [Thermodesulfobacteriota bacterium]|nr:glycosyltransferase [Thermodesulfobacteriota bacterium]
MIVKNEEDFLPGCLASVRDVADEIVIVDTGSGDRTIEIAKKFGARIYKFPWDNNFSHARNKSLRYAIGEWIFILDADERLSKESRPIVKKIIDNPSKQAYSVKLYLDDNFLPIDVLRIFRRSLKLHYTGLIHEVLEPSPPSIEDSEVSLLHINPHNKKIKRKKYNRNMLILKKQLKDDPDDVYCMAELGRYYLKKKRFKDALKHYNQALCSFRAQNSSSEKNPADVVSYKYLIEYYGEVEKDFEKAHDLCLEGINSFPLYPWLFWYAGILLIRMKSYENAIHYFLTCHLMGKNGKFDRTLPVDKDILGYKPLHGMGVCYFHLKNYQKARKYFQEALSLNPYH